METTSKKIAIGTATIRYDEEGNLTSATFAPEVHPTVVSKIDQELLKADKAHTADDAKRHAETVLAEWYGWLWDIELADREEGRVEGEIVNCIKWPNDVPQECVVRLYFVAYQQ